MTRNNSTIHKKIAGQYKLHLNTMIPVDNLRNVLDINMKTLKAGGG
jgi:hypothetical protein